MIAPSQKSIPFLFILMALMSIPQLGLSQQQLATPAKQGDINIETKTSAKLSLDELNSMRAEVENSGELAEDAKKAVLSLVDRAISFLEREKSIQTEIANNKAQIKTAPERIQEIEAELDRPEAPLENIATTASNMNADQREIRLAQWETDLSDSTTILKDLTDRLNALKDRPSILQEEIAELKQRHSAIAEELKAPPAPDDSPLMVDARKAVLLAEQIKIQTEIESSENQLVNHGALMALLTAERDLATRTVARRQTLVKSWQTEVQRLRELEAKKERVVAEAAKKMAADMPPVVQKQYDVTIELGKRLEVVSAEEANISEQLTLKEERLKQLEEDYALAQEQVKYTMTSEAIGLALREQRRTLPSIENFQKESKQRRVQMGEIRAHLLDLDRQRRDLADLDQAVIDIMKSESDLPPSDLDLLKTELRQLLIERRELVKKLETGSQRLFKNLQRLDFIEQQIASNAQDVARFLDEHLLWIRSGKSIGSKDLQNLPQAVQWLFSPYNWWQVAKDQKLSFERYPIQWMLGILIPAALIGLRHRAHRALSRIARDVYSVKTDSFMLTLKAILLTLRAALGWPLLMGIIGWQLGKLSSTESFTLAVGNGLIFAAQTLGGSLFVYEMCWKQGLAKVHFKWPESTRLTLQRILRWFIPTNVTLGFIITAVQTKNFAAYVDSLGRLALIALMFAFFVVVAYLFRFSGDLVSLLMSRNREGWLVRLRYIWYPLTMGVPLLLVLLAGMGYHYSAARLFLRLGETIALILSLILAKDLVLRWLFIVQRRLVFEEIKRKKEADAQQQDQAETPPAADGEAVVIEEPEVKLDQIYEKNQALIRTIIFFSGLVGLWLIWANVLPALNVLEKVQLWSYTSEVEGVRTKIPVTLAELMAGIIIGIVTVVAAKNLPSMLEIILLNRFTMDYGARYAYTTIFSYAIVAFGVGITFSTIGIKWSNLQWLIAALSVGLGFGLQEVVANFICGLIVLFERPFRIGDTVTIADISGTVTRIQIRATTILDWDRKELIVPNKEFITGRLINWSLSDKIVRIKIPIGIAYGSDTELAEKLLIEAAQENPLIVENPAPQAVFMGFGDNSLNFEMRVFINEINNWIPMLHKLNQSVDRKVRQADVTISVPQRDVHLDQVGPLEVRVVRGDQ